MTDAARTLIEDYFRAVFEMVDPKIFAEDFMECLSAKGFKIVARESKDYIDGFKAAYRLGPTSAQAQIVGKQIIDEINAIIGDGPKTQRMDRLRKEKEMSKILTYSQDYMDGFRTAYILGPTIALNQIHKWDQDGHRADGKKIIDGLKEATEEK